MLNQFCRRLFRYVIAPGTVLALAAPAALAQTPVTPVPPGSPAQDSQQVQIPVTGPVLEMSMDQAVERAMQNNLGLKADRMNLDSAAMDIVSARSAFLPRLTTSLSRNTSSQQGLRLPDGTSLVSSSSQVSGGS